MANPPDSPRNREGDDTGKRPLPRHRRNSSLESGMSSGRGAGRVSIADGLRSGTSGSRQGRSEPKSPGGRAGHARNGEASAMPGWVKMRKRRREDLRVTMVNRGSTCGDGARPSRFYRRLPEPCRRRPRGDRRLGHGSGAWIVHTMCIGCASLPGHRPRRFSQRDPRLAPPRQPRLTPGAATVTPRRTPQRSASRVGCGHPSACRSARCGPSTSRRSGRRSPSPLPGRG